MKRRLPQQKHSSSNATASTTPLRVFLFCLKATDATKRLSFSQNGTTTEHDEIG